MNLGTYWIFLTVTYENLADIYTIGNLLQIYNNPTINNVIFLGQADQNNSIVKYLLMIGAKIVGKKIISEHNCINVKVKNFFKHSMGK